MSSADVYKVVVIGAGIAGLTATREIVNAGVKDVVLLEAQGYVGGRIKSEALGGVFADVGAQWIHGSESRLYQTAKAFDLIAPHLSEEGAGPYLRSTGEEVPVELVAEVSRVVGELLEECRKYVEDECRSPPSSIGAFLQEEFHKYLHKCDEHSDIKQIKRELFQWHLRFQVIDNSCTDLHKLSAKAWGQYKYCGGDDYVNFSRGFQSLPLSLVSDIPPSSLRLNTPVKSVFWKKEFRLGEPSVEVVCADGTHLLAHHAIVTSSIGYLKKHTEMFSPPLPDHFRTGLDCIGFDNIAKVFLLYSEEWWPSDIKGIQFVWRKEDTEEVRSQGLGWLVDVTGFDVLRGGGDGDKVLVGWVGGEGANQVESLSHDEIGQHVTTIFKRFLKKESLPLPLQVVRSAWGSNPFVGGGYSHIKSEAYWHNVDIPEVLTVPVYSSIENLVDPHPTLLFAGEALHKSHYSTVHGAMESGYTQAHALLKYFKKPISV